jgi:hypothetical protein
MAITDTVPQPAPVRPSLVARTLGLSSNFVRQEIRDGQMPGAFQIGSRGDWRIPFTSAQDYVRRLSADTVRL